MTADETPAQPETEVCCICDGSPTAVKGCPAHRVRYAAQQFARGQAVDKTLICLASVLGVEDAAPAPDGNAGGADDEVYFAAARAMLATDSRPEFALYEWHACSRLGCKTPCACSGQPYPSAVVRAAIDAARAPLLVEVERLTREYVAADREAGEHIEQIMGQNREIRKLTRERDEARAKTEELLDLLRDVWA